MNLLLVNKACLIVGASGTIGRAIATKFAQEGAVLALLTSKDVDVSQSQEVRRVIKEVGPVDVLVNASGIVGPIGPTSNVTEHEWEQTIRVNLLGMFNLVHAVLPGMLSRKRGKIINFSGGGAAYGKPFFTAYSASKAAVVRFTESLAGEVRDDGIDVNVIAPGPIGSKMQDQIRKAGKDLDIKLVSPDRAAALTAYLASDQSNGLTGRLISAMHDDWEHFDIPKIMASEKYTLRRVI